MHPEAFEFVSRYATDDPVAVLDLGGRSVNGSCRPLFPNADYTVIDLMDAWDVDIVADAADWQPVRRYDIVVSTETFEHTARWAELCATAYRALEPNGLFVITAAGERRAPHSGLDGEALRAGEYYRNVVRWELETVLAEVGFEKADVVEEGLDVRAVAWR